MLGSCFGQKLLIVLRVWGVAKRALWPKINHVYRCSYLIREGCRCSQMDVIYYAVLVTQYFNYDGVSINLMTILLRSRFLIQMVLTHNSGCFFQVTSLYPNKPDGSITKISQETQTEGSRVTSKARMWRKNTFRKVLTSFHLVVWRQWRYKGRGWGRGRGISYETVGGAQHLYPQIYRNLGIHSVFGPVFSTGESTSVSKWAKHQVWLTSSFTARVTGISSERTPWQWGVQLRTP